MSLEVDGAAILAALASDPEAFSMTKPQVDTIATAAVVSKLKEKSLSLAALRSIADRIGHRDFSTIVGGLTARDAKALAKLDGNHPDYGTAGEHWHRAHIIRLGKAEAEPTHVTGQQAAATRGASPKAPAPAEPVSKLPKIGKIMASKAQATAGKPRKPRKR